MRSPPHRVAWHRATGLACEATGSPWSFLLAVVAVIAWLCTGPLFGYSAGWQLVINTGTTIVTFLMVFIIQHQQNRDMRALQLKLDELIAAIDTASNELIDIEDLDDAQLASIAARYRRAPRPPG